MKCLDERLLAIGQFNRITIKSFTFLCRGKSAGVDNQVCILSQTDSFSLEFIQGTIRCVVLLTPCCCSAIGSDWTAHRKSDFDILSGYLLYTIEN